MCNPKVENYVLLGRQTEDLGPEDSLSDSSEGLLPKGKGGAGIYRRFCSKKQIEHQNITVN